MAKVRPGTTVEAEDQIMVSLANNQAREMLEQKKAPSQIVAIYAKEGTETERLKKQKLRAEIDLLEAKKKQVELGNEDGKKLNNALDAFKVYAGKEEYYD